MIVEIKKLAQGISVTRKSTDLFTRYVGRLLFQKIIEKLQHIAPHEVVIIDFDGIRAVDASFVDECLVPLLKVSQTNEPPFYIKLINISDNVEYIVGQVISMEKEPQRYIVITDRLCKNGCHALGRLSEIEKDIIEYFVINRQATSDDIASFLHLSGDEANTVCSNLHKARAIRKIYDSYVFYCVY